MCLSVRGGLEGLVGGGGGLVGPFLFSVDQATA